MQHKILIVDDLPMNVLILKKTLQADYQLETASSGEEALAKATTFQPALILLDIMMPGIDGYETCRRIRATPDLCAIKVIMVSARALPEERMQGYQAGADDYIIKPFERHDLLTRVRSCLTL